MNSHNNHTTQDISNEDIQSLEKMIQSNSKIPGGKKRKIQMNSTRQTINNINNSFLDG